MPWDPADQLRALLGERIPDGGSSEDTFFSDEEVQNLLDESQGSVRRGAYSGWQMKAAYYAEMVNVTEGNALRNMSDLHNHALAMIKQFSGSGNSLTSGRARVGRIIRR